MTAYLVRGLWTIGAPLNFIVIAVFALSARFRFAIGEAGGMPNRLSTLKSAAGYDLLNGSEAGVNDERLQRCHGQEVG